MYYTVYTPLLVGLLGCAAKGTLYAKQDEVCKQ